jgi:murein DD-endopeptidase MepM/ murein hydrolase activator NlpD
MDNTANPALRSTAEKIYQNLGGDNMNQGQQMAFNEAAKTIGVDPVQIALELSKQQSANAVNSSLGISTDSSIHNPSSLKGYPITQQFGNYNPGIERFSNGVNSGVDIGVPANTPIFLPNGNWKVLSAFNGAKSGYIGDNENSGYGNSVYVQNVDTGEKLRFSHLNSINVPSDIMTGGQAVGLSGRTGNTSGNHLDLEYYNKTGQLADFLNTSYANSLGL